MTFQNLLSRIPKWNETIIETEVKRIVEQSGCSYLEDLITCVHIIQLKTLTAVRVATKMKKIDIDIPKLEQFIHRVYIFTARKIYSNVYLFERHAETGADKNGETLIVQKNSRELELIVNDCILNAIRESIPIEDILRAYMDESVHVEEEIIIGPPLVDDKETNPYVSRSVFSNGEIPDNNIQRSRLHIENVDELPVKKSLTFNQIDSVVSEKDELASLEKVSGNVGKDLSYVDLLQIQPTGTLPTLADEQFEHIFEQKPNAIEPVEQFDIIDLDNKIEPAFKPSDSEAMFELDDIEIL